MILNTISVTSQIMSSGAVLFSTDTLGVNPDGMVV